MTKSGSSPSPLAGIRVIDMTRVLAGPTATQILGDLGADIIKIERPKRGDDSRSMGPPYLTDDNTHQSAYFLSVNRNKQSLALDITCSEGQDIARQLIRKSDILVENFRAQTLNRYGLGYADISTKQPELIYCSLTGFGQSGPYATRGGYDYLVQALGGLMSVTGHQDGPPMKVGIGVCDIMTGLYATIAIMAALQHRQTSGQGQHIDMALLDCQIAALSYLGQGYLISDKVPQRIGNNHHNIVPYQSFAASDGLFILAVGNDDQFKRLCRFADSEHLIQDKRFDTNSARVRHRHDLTALLNAIIVQRPVSHWVEGLTAVNVPCSPINNIDQVFADPQVQARGMVQHLNHQKDKNIDLPLISSPIKLEQSPVSYRYPPPLLGEHSHHILSDILHLDEATISNLKNRGIVDTSDDGSD